MTFLSVLTKFLFVCFACILYYKIFVDNKAKSDGIKIIEVLVLLDILLNNTVD